MDKLNLRRKRGEKIIKCAFEYKGRDEFNLWWESLIVEFNLNLSFKLFIYVGRKFRVLGTWEFNFFFRGVRVGLSRILGYVGWNVVSGRGVGLYEWLFKLIKSRKNWKAILSIDLESIEVYGWELNFVLRNVWVWG